MCESGWRGEGHTEEAGEPEEGDDDDRDEEAGQTAVPAPSPADSSSSSTARVLGSISFNRAGGRIAVFRGHGHEQERERRVRFHVVRWWVRTVVPWGPRRPIRAARRPRSRCWRRAARWAETAPTTGLQAGQESVNRTARHVKFQDLSLYRKRYGLARTRVVGTEVVRQVVGQRAAEADGEVEDGHHDEGDAQQGLSDRGGETWAGCEVGGREEEEEEEPVPIQGYV